MKTRSGKLSLEKRKEALNQATSFSDFLSGLKDESDKWKIWAIAQRHPMAHGLTTASESRRTD